MRRDIETLLAHITALESDLASSRSLLTTLRAKCRHVAYERKLDSEHLWRVCVSCGTKIEKASRSEINEYMAAQAEIARLQVEERA